MSLNYTEARKTLRQLERQFRLFQDLAGVLDAASDARADVVALEAEKVSLREDIAALNRDHAKRLALGHKQVETAKQAAEAAEAAKSISSFAEASARKYIQRLQESRDEALALHQNTLAALRQEEADAKTSAADAVDAAREAREGVLKRLGAE